MIYCPVPSDIESFLCGDSTSVQDEFLLQHVDQCASCRELLDGRLQIGPLRRLLSGSDNLGTVDSQCEEVLSSVLSAVLDNTVSLRDADQSTDGVEAICGLPDLPAEVGEYTLDQEIGRGGMGIVYLAHNRHMPGMRFAAKKIRRHRDSGYAEHVKNEVATLSHLDHDSIVAVRHAEEFGDSLFVFMEYLDGPDLARLAKQGPVRVTQACEIIGQVASGLRAAHESGYVHRDIKPSNIILDADGNAKIVDFGLAMESTDGLCQSAGFAGTPEYAAPEQCRGKAVDHRADIYSLGATFYYLLAGKPPKRSVDFKSIRRGVVRVPAEQSPVLSKLRNDIPDGVSSIVESMLADDAADRIDLDSLLRRLEAYRPGQRKANRYKMILLSLLACAVVAAVVVTVFVKTDFGTVIVESEVDGATIEIVSKSSGKTVTITTSRTTPNNVSVKAGDVTVRVVPKNHRVIVENAPDQVGRRESNRMLIREVDLDTAIQPGNSFRGWFREWGSEGIFHSLVLTITRRSGGAAKGDLTMVAMHDSERDLTLQRNITHEVNIEIIDDATLAYVIQSVKSNPEKHPFNIEPTLGWREELQFDGKRIFNSNVQLDVDVIDGRIKKFADIIPMDVRVAAGKESVPNVASGLAFGQRFVGRYVNPNSPYDDDFELVIKEGTGWFLCDAELRFLRRTDRVTNAVQRFDVVFDAAISVLSDSQVKLRVNAVKANKLNTDVPDISDWSFNLNYDGKRLFGPNIELVHQ